MGWINPSWALRLNGFRNKCLHSKWIGKVVGVWNSTFFIQQLTFLRQKNNLIGITCQLYFQEIMV